MATSASRRFEYTTDSDNAERLRHLFHDFNPAMVVLWRLGLGRWADTWPSVGGRLLVIEHEGRKSGNRYVTPLDYSPSNGSVFCIAAFGDRTDWLRNVLAMESVTVWRSDGRWRAIPRDASNDPDRLPRMRSVLIDSGFAAPAFGLLPRTMSDEDLETATADYRLVEFELVEKLDGGSGDLAWIWLPIGIGLAALVAGIIVRRRSCSTVRPSR